MSEGRAEAIYRLSLAHSLHADELIRHNSWWVSGSFAPAPSVKIASRKIGKFQGNSRSSLTDFTVALSCARYFYCVFQKCVVHSRHPASTKEGRTRRHGR